MAVGSWPPPRSRPAYDDILCDVRFDAAFLPPDSDLTHLKEEIENRIVAQNTERVLKIISLKLFYLY